MVRNIVLPKLKSGLWEQIRTTGSSILEKDQTGFGKIELITIRQAVHATVRIERAAGVKHMFRR